MSLSIITPKCLFRFSDMKRQNRGGYDDVNVNTLQILTCITHLVQWIRTSALLRAVTGCRFATVYRAYLNKPEIIHQYFNRTVLHVSFCSHILYLTWVVKGRTSRWHSLMSPDNTSYATARCVWGVINKTLGDNCNQVGWHQVYALMISKIVQFLDQCFITLSLYRIISLMNHTFNIYTLLNE